MRSTFRDSDVFARLGGDEFVVFLTNTSTELATDIIVRFRQSVETYNQGADRGYNIAFSDGIVTVEGDQNRSIEALLSRADSLMYENKRERPDVNSD